MSELSDLLGIEENVPFIISDIEGQFKVVGENVFKYDENEKRWNFFDMDIVGKELFSVPKASFLNIEEHRWLSDFVYPFKDRIKYISLQECGDKYFLRIDIKEGEPIILPTFEPGKHFTLMTLRRRYTLFDLNL